MQPVQPDTAEPSDGNPPSTQAGSHARRRQFLRASAGVVPVTLTLASRPVRAWHCNTSSAWGSEQVSPNASVIARNNSKELVDETWTISNWQNNTTRAGLTSPWTCVKSKWGFASVLQAQIGTTVPLRSGLTVAQLFSGGPSPTGLLGTSLVYKVLRNEISGRTTTTFQNYMIVAKLNALFITSVAACLKSNGTDQLPDMIDGSFQPTNLKSAPAWDQTTIMQYLTDNYIVQP